MFALALVVVPGVTHATEEPDHEVLRRLDSNIEIRQYKPYVVAEVLVEGSADTAGNDAFPILAGYIFGK
ncbi:MAG: heme-binding protein, partial [Candidatus Accumulibacter sp.]|nr:heme-binding protein [Accumulibacter sp.]